MKKMLKKRTGAVTIRPDDYQRRKAEHMRRMHSKKKRKKKQKRQSVSGKLCISCMVLVLTLIMTTQIVRLHHKDQEYQQKLEQLQSQLEEEQQRSDELADMEDYIGTDEYYEDMARTRLGMVFQDEILFKQK